MSTSTHRVLAVVGGLALTIAGTLVGAPTDASPAPRAAVQRLETTLRPSGDPDGSGEAHFTLNKARKKVCATVSWQNVQQPDAAHIHRVSDGSIVVDLTGSVTGGSKCRTGVPKRVIRKLLAHPENFYFNVHNPTYPAGAIQGTLRR